MARIRLLAEAVANQIAAGEVIERPASVVKELVENAIDSGATRIAVTIAQGGRALCRVADDGSGIAGDDVSLAFATHATSKLERIEELGAIGTLGFRGEALPSIASVSRLTLTTLAAGEDSGTRIVLAGGKVEALDRVAFAAGTTVEVRDLFYNVPARLKFLRSTAAETGAVTAMLTRLVLAHPGIHFSLERDGKVHLSCPKAASSRERVGQILGHERGALLIEARRSEGGVTVDALLDPPARHAPTRAEQHLFVNLRPIADRGLQHALGRAYDGLLPEGRFPAAFVFLTVAPGLVDVNVHPAKSEVRFVDPTAAHSLLRQTVREALARGGFVPELRAALQAGGVREAAGDYIGGAASGATEPDGDPKPETAPARIYLLPAPSTSRTAAPAGPRAVPSASTISPPAPGFDPCRSSLPGSEGRGPRVLGQFRSTFIVAADDRGLLLLDQHTAHERILFEKLGRERGPGTTGGQRLLIPVTVELPAALSAVVGEALPELVEAGIEVEPIGERTLVVRSLPAGASTADAAAIVRECLEGIARGERGTDEARRHRVLATVACHAAVKVNMPLDTAKMEWIVAEVLRCEDPFVCPHGRAVQLRLDDEAIKRSFGRYW